MTNTNNVMDKLEQTKYMRENSMIDLFSGFWDRWGRRPVMPIKRNCITFSNIIFRNWNNPKSTGPKTLVKNDKLTNVNIAPKLLDINLLRYLLLSESIK